MTSCLLLWTTKPCQENTMAQMAHFSFPYYFAIPNSEFRIKNSEFRIPKFVLQICTTNFGIRNCEVCVMWARGNL